MAITFKKFFEGINVVPKSGSTAAAAGDVEFDSATNKFNIHNGTTASPVVSEAHTATLTNKTFDADGTGNSITNIENADIKAGAAIDAAKIHDGSVSNTEFGYLNGVTSAIQTQLNTKIDSIGDTITSATQGSILFAGASGVLAQDNANLFWDDTNKRLGIGTDADDNTATIATTSRGIVLGVKKESDTDNIFGLSTFSDTANPYPWLNFYRARGTEASKTVVSSGDILGGLRFHGWDGTDYALGAAIQIGVDTTPGAGDMPSNMVFYTSPDGSETITERMRIDSAGNIGIGRSPSYRLDVETSAVTVARFLRTGNASAYIVAGATGCYFSGDTGGNTSIGVDDTNDRVEMWAGGAERMRIDGTGLVQIGSSVTNNYNGAVHKISGSISSANVTSTANSGRLYIGNNIYFDTTAAGAMRTETTRSGSGMYFDNESSDTSASIKFFINQTGDTTTTVADLVGSVDGNGRWNLGISNQLQILSTGVINATITSWGSSATQDIGFSVTTGAGSFEKFTSSQRYKYEIQPLTFDSSKILQLQAKQFRWNSNNSLDFGFIAEEVNEVLPEAVIYMQDENGFILDENNNPIPEAVKYRQLTAVIIEELKKLRAEFDAYKASHP